MAEVSATNVKHDLESLRRDFFLEETEDNWEKISKAIEVFMKVGEQGGYEFAPAEVVIALRNFHRPITNALNSERTRLCGTALDLVSSVAGGLGRDFDQVMPLFMPSLLTVCSRTNKVVMNRTRNTILGIIESTQLASALPYFVQSVKDKAATLRLVVAEATLACLNSCNPPDLEKVARARDIETIIRGTARDANPDVRQLSRKVFDSYKILLPSRVDSFTAPLSPMMKKYLNIQTTVLMTSKSTSNLRDHLVERKPSASSSTTLSNVGHSRTASSSTTVATANQTKNLAARLTRDKRKDPVSNPAHPPPIRSVQTSGVVSNPQKTNPPKSSATATAPGPARAVSNPEPKPIVAPMRSQASTHSRTTSTTSTVMASTAPRRLQLSSEPKITAITSQTATSGPRRIPMLPPALKKDYEAPKRPASRVDNTVSTTSSKTSMVPPPHPTKKVDASVPPKKDVPCAKPPVPKFRPETNTNSTARQAASSTTSSSTKPLANSKAKPTWGRAAPPAKPGPGASQKASAKEVVKKPSSLVSKTAAKAEPPRKRPTTPAMVALPPSPDPEAAPKQEKEAETDSKTQITTGEDVKPESVPSPLPEVQVTIGEDDTDKTIQNDEHTQTTVSPTDSRLSTPVTEEAGAVTVEHAEKQGPTSEFQLPSSNEDLPCTPHSSLLPKPAVTNTTAKTPISALLFSIERGFMYSPTTPLSPADCYLPGPNGEITYNHETHAPRVEGPMQPFNYALHANSKGTLFDGTTPSEEGLKVLSRDIGVMGLEERTKLHGMQMGLPLLEDATVTRNAFVEINGI